MKKYIIEMNERQARLLGKIDPHNGKITIYSHHDLLH